MATMRAAQFVPLEAYPGADKPWRCLHEPCGQVRTPKLNTVRRNGTACRPCWLAGKGFTEWTAKSAETHFRNHGLEPLQPYPGSSAVPWPARHTVCGRVVAPRLGNVAAGQGPCRECGLEAAHAAQRLDHDEAAALMRIAGLEPLEPFPGVDHPWRCRHARCGGEVSPTYTNTKRGQRGCRPCAAQEASARLLMPEPDARAIMNAADLEPVEPYPGSGKPWRCRHSCGMTVTPTLNNVAQGLGICRYCNSRFPYAGPAMVYLVVDRRAVKIGIAKRDGTRIDEHRRQGWQLAWSVDVPTGDDAYNLEQAVIAWWRDELGLLPAYTRDHMPQSGATETAMWDNAPPDDVLAKVVQLADTLNLPALSPKLTHWHEVRPSVVSTSRPIRAPRRSVVSGQLTLPGL
ncbi:hypothetical protein MRU69_10385 [Kocuria flava]|uniref:hypothetical protein n=1 Tax=Kocuria flava TaxID=446860 RepID=UPI001FF20356|nr:hypothetical protein [Kocuria flava]MCJ8505264.1 hypothetical protein [Kocuria flava]